MTAQKLANRIAMSALIEFYLECAAPAPEQPPLPPSEVFISFHEDDLLVGENDLDVLQCEEESAFFSQMAMNRSSRESRRFLRSW